MSYIKKILSILEQDETMDDSEEEMDDEEMDLVNADETDKPIKVTVFTHSEGLEDDGGNPFYVGDESIIDNEIKELSKEIKGIKKVKKELAFKSPLVIDLEDDELFAVEGEFLDMASEEGRDGLVVHSNQGDFYYPITGE